MDVYVMTVDKKVFLAGIIVFELLGLLVIGIQAIKVANANPYPEFYNRLTIDQPLNITYFEKTLVVNFTVEFVGFLHEYNYFCVLDGEKLTILNLTSIMYKTFPTNPMIYNETLVGNFTLSNLSASTHNLTVYQSRMNSPGIVPANFSYNVQFTVLDKAPSPTIPEFPFWMISPLAVACFLSLAVLTRQVHRKNF